MNRLARTAAQTLCLFSLIFSTYTSLALAAEAELVWVEHDLEWQIMFSRLQAQGWSKPLAVYQSDNPLTSLALVTDLDNNKILVWTEQFKSRSVLMKMQSAGDTGRWSKAELLSDFGKENFASTMVVDAANTVWLFWSANHGKLDDIYLIKRSKQGWSKPQQINNQNQVPDILPMAQLDAAGNVSLDWRSFSVKDSAYVTLNRVFKLEMPWQNGYKADPKDAPEMSLADVVLPDFLPGLASGNAVALMHFPTNRMHQTEKIQLNSSQ